MAANATLARQASCSAGVYKVPGLDRSVSACHYKRKPMCTCLIARVRDVVHSTLRIRGCSGAHTCECGVRRSLIALELN